MHFVAHCTDKPGSTDLRAGVRPDHIEWIGDHVDQIQVAGPLLDDGGSPIGSLLIVEAESRERAAALLAADPYAKAGLFQTVTITPWKWVIGQPDN